MNKTRKIIVAISLLICLFGGYFIYQKTLGNSDSKTIHVLIQTETDVLFDEEVTTHASKLSELLQEMKEKGTIQLEAETSAYGMYITGMGVDTLMHQDESKGLYWTYESSNNKQCQESVYCDAADSLVIEDKDEFVFSLKGFNE